ncbi:MAG: site-specific integrase [Ancrocorticia sp.]|nr:site-specific integrase [Ancrocorticia sp.]MCI2002438.1 site-specific integrase [Ancrocorticia sp.]
MRRNMFRVRVSYLGKQYECGEYQSLKLAKIALEKYQAQAILGTFVAPVELKRRARAQRAAAQAQKTTVGQWSAIWLESLSDDAHRRSPGTIASYRSTLRAHILPALGETPLTALTPEQVEECANLARERGEGAYRNVVRTMRAMLNAAVAVQVGGLTVSPLEIKLGKTGSRRRTDEEIPSAEEVTALANAMPPELELAVLLAAWCQLRLGEVLGLQRQDFRDLDKPGKATLHVARQWLSKANPPTYGAPKDDSERTVVVPNTLANKVVKHLAQYTPDGPEAPVFASSLDKTRPISHNAFARRWNAAREIARPGTEFHALRHFGLSMYARTGATTAEIMRRGGHKDVEAASRYQHGSLKRDQELTAQLDSLIGSK